MYKYFNLIIMKYFNFCVLCVVFFGLLSCHQKTESKSNPTSNDTEIIAIVWSRFGGEMGYHESYMILEDSIIHTYFIAAKNNSILVDKYINKKQEWEKLTKSLVLNDFNKIKNGSSNLPIDGTDEQIYIETKTSADTIINGYKDANNYAKIINFVGLLDKIRTKKNNFENN